MYTHTLYKETHQTVKPVKVVILILTLIYLISNIYIETQQWYSLVLSILLIWFVQTTGKPISFRTRSKTTEIVKMSFSNFKVLRFPLYTVKTDLRPNLKNLIRGSLNSDTALLCPWLNLTIPNIEALELLALALNI